MRIERVQAAAFGGLEAFDSGEEPLGELVVVSGRNESGKTTFFHMLGAILYGIYPTSLDQHPYAPWSGTELNVEADLRVDGDEVWNVRRRLRAAPAGLLTRGDDELTLRNETLPCATHVPRTVFHQVFALTLAEVATLESEAWSKLQDRLIGAMGARDLVTARSAAEELEGEAGALWRPDRRGKQKVRTLRDKVQDAKARRRQASDTDRLLRDSVGELERARDELRSAKLLREQQRLLIERTTTLLPTKKLLDQVVQLEQDVGSKEDLEGIPADPVAAHGRLAADLEKLGGRLAQVCENSKAPKELIAAFGAHDSQVLDARAAIEHLGAEVAGSKTAHNRLGALSREAQDRRRHVEVSVNEIFTRSLSEDEEGVLRRIVPSQLRDRVRSSARVRDRQKEEEIRSSLRRETPAASLQTLVLGSVMGLTAGLLWASSLEASWLSTVIGTLALAAAVAITRWWTMKETSARSGQEGSSQGRDPSTSTPRTESSEAETSIHDKLLDVFGDLPMREEVLQEVGPELAATITRLQELLQDIDTRIAETDDLTMALKKAREQIASVGAELGIDLPSEDSAAVHVLQSTLRESQRAEESSVSAARELEVLERSRLEIRQELDERTRDLNVLEDAARRLGQGDVSKGLENAARRQSAQRRAEQIREDLHRSHPDLEDLIKRLDQLERTEGGPMGDDELAVARIAVDEQSNHIEELTGSVKELEHRCARASEQATADQVDGEIEALDADLDHLESEHDRKLLLAHVIREADRRFRDEHQPDVVRRAAGYLKTITSARYDRINVGEGGSFHVRGAGSDALVEASRLSTGAREQLYLSIRLAVMNHLDQGRERLPLCVDEAFVNWDTERRKKGFELLRQLLKTRQVFVMTCHGPWADELVDLGARRIELK